MKSFSLALSSIILAAILVTSMFLAVSRSMGVNNVTSVGNYETKQLPEYDPWKDINGDGVIDVTDFQLLKVSIPSAGDPTKKVIVERYEVVKWQCNFSMGWWEIRDLYNDTEGYRQITIIFWTNYWDATITVKCYILGTDFQVDSIYMSPNTPVVKTYQIQGEKICVTISNMDSGGDLSFNYYMTP